MERETVSTRATLGIGRLFDTVRDAIVIADASAGVIILWNPAAERLFGWSAAEIEGKPLETIIPPRFRARHRAGLARYQETGRGNFIDTGHAVLLAALRKDGTEVEIELMLSPLEVMGRHVIAVVRDVSQRQRRERDLRRANEDLEAFTHVVSHDLKEPVRALDHYLEELEEDHGARLDDKARALLAQARAASDRLRDHLERLLDYSRASRSDLPRTPLDVPLLIRDAPCQALWENLAKERGASVLLAAQAPPVLGDAGSLCQALGNLLGNAIKHNPSTPPVVRVRVEAEGDQATIIIEDNGPGFPAPVLRAFSEGARSPGAGPGGGFGLAIARRAMERQDGSMSIANKPEGGAVVRLTLPLA